MFLTLSFLIGCVPKADYVKLENQYKRSQQRVENLEANLAAQTKITQQLTQDLRDLTTDLKPLIDQGIVNIEFVDGQIVIGLDADVLFASGSAELSNNGKQNIATLTNILKNRAMDHDFQVQGHTDSQPIATPEFPNNWYLGAARAIRVTEYMISMGFSSSRISAASYASYQPVESNSSTEGRRQNRRIEVVVLPDLGGLPAFQEVGKERPKSRKRRRGQE